jgi:hypothetical protein
MSRKDDNEIYDENRKNMVLFSDYEGDSMDELDEEEQQQQSEETNFDDICRMKDLLQEYSRYMSLPLCQNLTVDSFYE